MRIIPVDAAERRDSTHTADRRAIFAYGEGLGLRGDPLAVERRYDESMATKNSQAVAKWLDHRNPSVVLLGYRRLVAAAHDALGTCPLGAGGDAPLSADEALAVIARFFAFKDRLAGEYREEAELLATYGPAFGTPAGPPSYRRHCGLWWNRRRVQSIAAVAAWRAAIVAKGGPLHQTMADAMASGPAEAAEIAEQYEADRQLAASQEEHRRHRAGG